jgi:hypothetical protein
LETQLYLIDAMGLENDAAQQMQPEYGPPTSVPIEI